MNWWQSLIVTVVQAVLAAGFGGFLAAWMVGSRTQKWIEQRERRNRRDQLRVELYLDVIGWIEKTEAAIAQGDGTGRIMDMEMQRERLNLWARLELLGSAAVKEAYAKYKQLARSQYEDPLERREPHISEKTWDARQYLIQAMAADVQQ